MNGWQIQAMKEAEDARIWEELNAPDPYEREMELAAAEMNQAISFLDQAETKLVGAVSELQGTPMESVIASILDGLENLHVELHIKADCYERGRRE